MAKVYSRREREKNKLYKKILIVLICFGLSLSVLIVVNNLTGSQGKYTPEQLLHDHDGDGIPDH